MKIKLTNALIYVENSLNKRGNKIRAPKMNGRSANSNSGKRYLS